MAKKLPKLCQHRASGRGYVTDPATGKAVYLGEYGSEECQQNYESWVQSLLARRAEVSSGSPRGTVVSVAELVNDYLDHAGQYYRKRGKPTSEIHSIRIVCRLLLDSYAGLPCHKIGPEEIRHIREVMIGREYVRKSVNNHIGRIRRIFRWGVSTGLVPPDTLTAITSVEPLKSGRTRALDRSPVQPVPISDVEKTLQKLDVMTASMVRIHLYGAMRADEVIQIRGDDIDRSVSPWKYIPSHHKTEHHGKDRVIWLGPAAQEVLAPLLSLQPTGYLFQSRLRKPVTVAGYRKKIRRACLSARIPVWFPLQLRHTALTLIRSQFGLEAAQVAAGHATADVTQIYAERDSELARRVALETRWH